MVPPLLPIAVAVGEGASMWMPPENYFVPYFKRLHTRLKETLSLVYVGLDASFAKQEWYL